MSAVSRRKLFTGLAIAPLVSFSGAIAVDPWASAIISAKFIHPGLAAVFGHARAAGLRPEHMSVIMLGWRDDDAKSFPAVMFGFQAGPKVTVDPEGVRPS